MTVGCHCVAPFPYQPTLRGGLVFRGFGDASAAGTVLATGKGASTGAAAGASVASAIGASAAAGSVVPVIGTVIGAVAGLLASGVLNKTDQEIGNWNQAIALYAQNAAGVYNISDKYLVLAGLFDLQPSQIKGNIPIYRKYGRLGEQKFVTDMVTTICNAASQIGPNDTPQSIMARIVQPWIDGWNYGPMADNNADLIDEVLLGMIAEYVGGQQTRWVARSGDYPFGSLPTFASCYAAAHASATQSATTVQPVGTSPAQSSAGGSSDGSALIVGQSGSLVTGDGAWSFGSGSNANGVQVLLNGNPASGAYAVGLTTYGGNLYQINSGGAWYMKRPGQGWGASPAPPNGNAVAAAAQSALAQGGQPPTAPPAASTQSGAVSTTPQTVPVPASVPVAPVIGGVLTAAQDPSSGQIMTLPAGATYGGQTPSGAWIITYASGANAGNYTLFRGQLIPYNTTAQPPATVQQVVAGTTTVATTSTGAAVTSADIQSLVTQLQAQGQSAQQAYTSALQALQSQGVQATPAVQQAVQQATTNPTPVQAAGFSLSSVGIVAAVGALYLLFKPPPAGSGGRRRRAGSRVSLRR